MTFDFSNTVSNILKKSKHNFLGIPRFKRLSSIPIIALRILKSLLMIGT